MSDDLYQAQLLEEYANPQHWGKLKEYTHQATYGNASCGDSITVTLVLTDGKVSAVGWEGQGCAISLAAMSVLSDRMIGMTVAEVTQLAYKEIIQMLGLETLTTARLQCAQVGLGAVIKAIGEGDVS